MHTLLIISAIVFAPIPIIVLIAIWITILEIMLEGMKYIMPDKDKK